MKLVRSLALMVLPTLALISFLSEPAKAQTTFISTDTTINTDLNSVVIGYANNIDRITGQNKTSPTVDLVAGGSALSISEYNTSNLYVNGGSVSTFVRTFDTSGLFLNDGNIDFGVTASGMSRIHIDGGVTSNVLMQENSRLAMTTGSADTILLTDHAVGTVYGGYISDFLEADGNSILNVWGGVFTCLFAQDNGQINLFGMDITLELEDPNYLDFYTMYMLSGKLWDGTDLTGVCLNIENNGSAGFTITEVPEPGTIAYVSTASVFGIGFLVRRRRS